MSKERRGTHMKKAMIYICLCFIGALILYIQWEQPKDQTTVKFFPLDQEKRFEDTSTSLTLLSESDQDEYDIQWKTESLVDEPIYLRQDVSLLYSDGQLKGILSKWKESGQNLFQDTNVHGEDSSHYQAITFHHGELHYPDDNIKSIQDMSKAELYVIDSPLTPLESFETPENTTQKDWKKTLDHATNQQLHYEWNKYINHFQINKSQYEAIPLTSLPDYETKPFPSLSADQTLQVIGQLWEGLYKNYVLEFTSNKDEPSRSYVPLVLAEKKGTHLLVLFENSKGEKEKLIQRYPFSSTD